MNHFLTLTDTDIFEPSKVSAIPAQFADRRAARAIVFSDTGGLYLLKMANQNYHKLPGGGIDNGESIEQALHRELLEEIGCPATILQEVGTIEEYRNEWALHQISYCYIAKQTAPLVATALEKSEIDDGAQTIVVQDIDAAIALLKADEPLNYDGQFIKPRDLRFLREAKRLFT